MSRKRDRRRLHDDSYWLPDSARGRCLRTGHGRLCRDCPVGIRSPDEYSLVASDASANARLGTSVAASLDGSTVFAGSPQRSGAVAYGAVYAYLNVAIGNGLTQTETSQLAPSANDYETATSQFGISVASSTDGRTVAVGAPGYGNIYIFYALVLPQRGRSLRRSSNRPARSRTSEPRSRFPATGRACSSERRETTGLPPRAPSATTRTRPELGP